MFAFLDNHQPQLVKGQKREENSLCGKTDVIFVGYVWNQDIHNVTKDIPAPALKGDHTNWEVPVQVMRPMKELLRVVSGELSSKALYEADMKKNCPNGFFLANLTF